MSGESSSGGFSPAKIAWELDSAGRQIPRSLDFDECYFSSQDGLAETRHVFLAGNRLADRFKRLAAGERFVIAETGFGVGLNFLAAAKLWQQSSSKGELHFISTELFGVSGADLRRAHASFPELHGISEQLLKQYPALIPGVHRVHFAELKITLDLWFGEASASLSKLVAPQGVDAWFLDGFSPRQNLELWAEPVFEQIARLSRAGTTAATFSAARVVKQGLLDAGFAITKARGFGNKRHMIQAWRTRPFYAITHGSDGFVSPRLSESPENRSTQEHSRSSIRSAAIIGAGIAGLCTAYKLAGAGIAVTLYEGKNPLSGSSGNLRAMLAPKITPYAYAADHLHTQSFLYAARFYTELAQLSQQTGLFKACGVADQPKQRSCDQWPALIEGYPKSFVKMSVLDRSTKAQTPQVISDQPSLFLSGAGIVTPHLVAKSILSHPLIELKTAQVTSVSSQAQLVADGLMCQYDQVVICAGSDTKDLIELGSEARTTKGQISWIKLSAEQSQAGSPSPVAQKFGGYAILDEVGGDQVLMFGATNERNYAPGEKELVTQASHLANLQKLRTGSSKLFSILSPSTQPVSDQSLLDQIEGRASIRFQLPDHMPLCGSITSRLSVISALGSKGFCYAPYAAELLKNLLLHEPNIATRQTLERLDPLRYLRNTPNNPAD